VPDSRDPGARRLDLPGSLLSIAGLATVLWALIEGPTAGWRSGSVLTAFAIGLTLIGLFLAWEHRTDHPMLDLGFFRNPRFSAASGAVTLTFMGLMGMVFVLTQYLQSVLGYSPIKAGAILLPMSALMMVLAPLSARFVERVGTKLVLGNGLLAFAGGLAMLTAVTTGTSTVAVMAITLVLGAGMANIMGPATESIMGSLPREMSGVGSAVNDTTRQMGGAIGVALIGSVMASRYGSHVESGLADAGLPAAVLQRVGGNIQAAIGVGRETGGPLGAEIVAVARDSYMAGMHLSMLVAAGVVLLGAVGVFLWLPARAAGPAPASARVSAAATGPDAEREPAPEAAIG
jgi:Na+/melibiose symporter-like transporter